MITKAQAENEASRVIQVPGQKTRIGISREVRGGWVFFPEPRALFAAGNAYYPPTVIVRADDGKVERKDGSTPLEHDLRGLGMSIGTV
jgi:hypothetical protein